MPEFQGGKPRRHLHGLPGLAAKRRAVGFTGSRAQKRRVVIRQIKLQHGGSQRRIIEAAPGFEIGLRERHRHKQAAVRGQPAQNGFGGRNDQCMVTRALILHIGSPFSCLETRP